MAHYWPYYRLRNDGVLVDDETCIPIAIDPLDGSTPCFASVVEAEQWLVDNDIRGSVRS